MAASVSRSSSSTAVTKNWPQRSLRAVEHGLDRRDIALAFRRLVDGCDQQMAVARVDGPENRIAGRAVGTEALRQLGETRIGADHRAGAVHGRDRHRGMVEEAHEADFGRPLRIGALVARAADHQRARGAGHAVGAEGELVIEPHRHGLAAAHAQVDVEDLGLDLARHRHDRGQQRGAIARHDVGQLQAARPDFRQIVIQPVGQRRVDIDDVAGGVDREETARRMIEIFDRVLQFLEHVLLAFAVAGDVGDRPHRVFGLALALAERPDPHPQPAAMAPSRAGNPDFFLLPLAFARRLEQAEHRFRTSGLPMKTRSTGRTSCARRRPRDREIGRVGIGHMAAGVGDGEAVIGEIGDAAHTGSSAERSAKRMMPAAKANRLNSPTIASSASSPRI